MSGQRHNPRECWCGIDHSRTASAACAPSLRPDLQWVPLCHMVCNNCGHIDTGPERGTYECESCGWGDGWGYGTDDRPSAEKKSAELIMRGRLDG